MTRPALERRRFLQGAVAGLAGILAAPLAAEAQPAGKVYRVGYLATDSGPVTAGPPPSEVFRQLLRELGWVDGQNIAIEFRSAEGRIDRLPSLAEEFVRLKVDVIYVPGGTPAARAAREATSTIPIVVGGVADPVRSGLVSSLARPGGNLTGLSLQSFDLGPKRLELLKQAVPTASRVAYLKAPGIQQAEAAEQFWKDLNAVARSLQMKIHRMELRGPDDFARAFAQMVQDRTDSLLVDNSGPLNHNLARVADLALKSRLPAIAEPRGFAEVGGLLAYGPNLGDMQLRAATSVDKILKGAKPGDLPIEQPTKFELVINLKTAKALGLTIPPSLLQRADQVIE